MLEPNRCGVAVNTSSAGFSEVDTAYSNGTRKRIATIVSRTCDTPERTRRPTTTAVSDVIVHPLALAHELDRGDGHDDHEQHPAGRRRQAHGQELPALVVDVHHDGLGGHARTTLGQDERLREHL